MSEFKFRDSRDFETLIVRRRRQGFEIYATLFGDKMVDRAVFLDTSWEALEELADAVVYMRFEIAKVGTEGLKNERIRLKAIERAILQLGSELFAYRERIRTKSPDLLTLRGDGFIVRTVSRAHEAMSGFQCLEAERE